MTTPAAVLKALAGSVPDLHVKRGLVVVLPLGHILRGLTFERTTSKGLYYLWRVVMPLYRLRPVLSLNYSWRIGSGNYLFDIGGNNLEAAVRDVSIAIAESNSLGAIKTIESPRDCLQLVSAVDTKIETNRRTLMDIAFSHWLVGETKECLEILLRSKTIPISYEYDHALSDEINIILDEIRTNPYLLSVRLANWESSCKKEILGDYA